MITDLSKITETDRLEQGGMGFLMYHAAVVQMRLLAKLAMTKGVSSTETGDVANVGQVIWHYEGGFQLTFDHSSFGHLLLSLDGEHWKGMDASYYPAPLMWEQLLRRIELMRQGIVVADLRIGGPKTKAKKAKQP